MGNKITRLGRRTFRIRMKRSKKNRGRKVNESECQCITIPNTGITQTCMNCVARIMQEVSTNRLPSNNNGQVCSAQFDAKKFDKIFKLNANRFSHQNESDSSSESDHFQFDDAVSDYFQSKTSEITVKIPREKQDDDRHSEKSYDSIFEVFEKLERNALLNSSVLDELFFYPAIGEADECGESEGKNSSFSSISDKSRVEETNQTDHSLLDETHIYDSVASSEKSSKITKSPLQRSFKSGHSKIHVRRKRDVKSKEGTQNKPIPFNGTQFYTEQIDDVEFNGIIFNNSQFDAKYFDATQFDITPFFAVQLEEPQNCAPKSDSLPQHCEIRTLKDSKSKAPQADVKLQAKGHKCNIPQTNDSVYNTTQNQCDDVKLSTALFQAGRPNVTEFEASIIRAAEFVASHFGAERFHEKPSNNKGIIPGPSRPFQFNGSQFNAKQFDVSKFSLTQCGTSDFYPAQFTASQFDAKAFDAQECSRFRKNRAPRLPDDCFNITQFDAKLFNAVQRDLRRVYAT